MPKGDDRMIEEVIETERRWVQAHRDLDIEVLESILAEDYSQIRANGSVIGKSEAVRSYSSGKRRWDHAESDQYHVRVFGNLAILIGRWTGRGENAGESFDYTARFMAIYVKRRGKWLLLADQSTPIG